MQANQMKRVSLGLGSLVIVAVVWLFMAHDSTAAVGSRSDLASCEGQINRFEMVSPRSNIQYLLDTCTGDVWTLTDVESEERVLQVWVKMYRYESEEDVRTIFESEPVEEEQSP